jgi:MoaA/NifB/PqqE/SkfB family radical SAM enzyme
MIERLVPQQIIIENTSRCNLACKLCPSLLDPRSGDMSLSTFKAIVDRIAVECPEATVIPWNNGEPLLHPDYDKMLTHLNSLGLRYYVTTNATLPRKDVFDAILDPAGGAYQIIFSLDGLPGHESRSIEIARPGTDREVVLGTIRAFMARARTEKPSLDVAVKICERGQDNEEVETFIQYWLSKGVSYVCVGKPLAGDNFESMRIYPCQYSDHKFMVIKSDLRLVPCAYNVDSTKGDIVNFGRYDGSSSILDAYNNPSYTSFREKQRAGIFEGPCELCTFAYTGAGLTGEVSFREGILAGERLFFKKDYYNTFYSRVDKHKDPSFYATTKRTNL